MTTYLSIKFNDITKIAYYMNRDMLEVTFNIGYPFVVYYLNGDWILYGFNEKCVMSERFNAIVKNNFKSFYFVENHITTKYKYYTISKFMLLRQLCKNNLVGDLLSYIVYITD